MLMSLKKIFLAMFLIFFVLGGTLLCNAADETVNSANPRYVNILRNDVTLNISGIKAECSASLRANNSTALKIKMELQKSKSSGYVTVETWTSSKTGTFLTISESRIINILYDYRLKVTFIAGEETTVVYKY